MDGLFGSMVSVDSDDSMEGREIVSIAASKLDKILRSNNSPKIIDYLSIDIEGAEDKALLNFPYSEYTFRSITIERPSKELQEVLESNHYHLVKKIQNLDYFYVHEDFLLHYMRNLALFWQKRLLKIRIH